MKINILKGENAITLIALIVTIIVLLILAMTSVSLVLRENLIKKAKTAKNEYEQAAQNEAESLNAFEDELNEYFKNNNENEGGTNPDIEVDDDVIAQILTNFMKGQTTEEVAVEQLKQNLSINDENVDSINDIAMVFLTDTQYAYIYKIDRLYKLDNSTTTVIYAEKEQHQEQYAYGENVKKIKIDLENLFIGKTVSEMREKDQNSELKNYVINGSPNIASADVSWSAGNIIMNNITNGKDVENLKAYIDAINESYYKVKVILDV